MTSEIEGIKTNEFLRRRKLRLQQVREQSKEIAKKIRQRAKVEKLRQIVDLDSSKQREYIRHQEKLIKKLEELHAKGIENVGASHKSACEARLQGEQERVDLSKIRGREAATELRRQKQEKLDEQKKLLDRKLQAREAANEKSREKSVSVASKVAKSLTNNCIESSLNLPNVPNNSEHGTDGNSEVTKDKATTTKSDMATQWDFEEIPNEWEPTVPALSLPKDDRDNIEESATNTERKTEKGKKANLFALSEEMPSSLRGGLADISEEKSVVRSSLNIVSEYLQNRALRLRENSTTSSSKKQSEDLTSIKHTILRTRAARSEGLSNVCHVLDEQVIPMPSWEAEDNCGYCTHNLSYHKHDHSSGGIRTITSSQINRILTSVRPRQDLLPSPVLRGTSPFRRNKLCQRISSAKGDHNVSQKSTLPAESVRRKSSVTIYNHSTRDTRDVPCHEDKLVLRDLQADEDAYSQAMEEASGEHVKERDLQKNRAARNRVAMSKQNIEKEYRDTMSFLNSLPKDTGNKPIRNAYKDQNRQQIQREHRQQKMQHEYKKIEKECKKHSCVNTKCPKSRSKSKSPVIAHMDDDFNSRDFQYSWMPVPESDGNLAIHTIPTTLKEGKSGNTVTFGKVDSYHEYRSRHKHTPPTKDTGFDKQKRNVERVFIQNASDSDLSTTDTSSVENLLRSNDTMVHKSDVKDADGKLSDAERIIIYKILDSKKKKKAKVTNGAKSLPSQINKSSETNEMEQVDPEVPDKEPGHVAFENLNEGVYKASSEKGDNISSMYYSDSPRGHNREGKKPPQCQYCHDNWPRDVSHNDLAMHWEPGNNTPQAQSSIPGNSIAYTCRCSKKKQVSAPAPQQPYPSAATSTSSFKTATTDKANSTIRDGGYIKLVDEGGQEAGKFYIGATGFLKDDAYEVVIQLRKRDTDKSDKREEKLVSVKNCNVNQMSEPMAEKMSQTVDVADAAVGKESENLPQTPANPPPSNVSSEVIINEILSEQESKPQSQTVLIVNPEHTKNTSDKGVTTSFQDSFAVPDHVSKGDPVSRPATSTYTQTSMNSPNQRPAYFHMSSSTSTAYMSPPEVILPGIFKRHGDLADDEMYDSMQNLQTTRRQRCGNVDCTCRNCIHGRKGQFNRAKLDTPPNTASSYQTHVHRHDLPCNTLGYSKKCHKCGNCTKSKMCLKLHRNKHFGANGKRSSKNLVMRVNSASYYKSKHTTNRSTDSKINPYIKDYVDKLLALNRESLRAIDVADQECSSVATPGSSVVNVPHNVNKNKPLDNKISLEQIKSIVKRQLLDDHYKKEQSHTQHNANTRRNMLAPRLLKKKQIHKVKSLNISKQLFKKKQTIGHVNEKKLNEETREDRVKRPVSSAPPTSGRPRSKSSPTPRRAANPEVSRNDNFNIVKTNTARANIIGDGNKYNFDNKITKQFTTQNPLKRHTFPITQKNYEQIRRKVPSLMSSRATVTPPPDESDSTDGNKRGKSLPDVPMDTSTQTSGHVNSEINYMELAENKLQNMEKIADLTEKCTKRLSNLAKVLEEVRKNKSLAYSQISTSDSASDVDQKSDRNATDYKSPVQFYDQIFDHQTRCDIKTPEAIHPSEKEGTPSQYVPLLTDIPKPDCFKLPNEKVSQSIKNIQKSIVFSPVESISKRCKPPPALSRISLKHGNENLIPHELSTVIEVDSPMSVKIKNQSTCNYTNGGLDKRGNENTETREKEQQMNVSGGVDLSHVDPDLLKSNIELRRNLSTIPSETSDESKLQMMDLKQFNDIMLKPFLSIHEYAKQCDIGRIDEGSNLENVPKHGAEHDDISSLHSDGSLPDVIAELLKRNIISEPFKFETTSNVNSTTVSSESTLSVLALSKIRKDKKKSSVMFSNKENVAETSDSMSISSNPDLENAFKKLGMGWASSTLKKTKERLALSSSSNTSSSSISQFKMRSFNNQDVPVLVTDSISALNLTKKEAARKVLDMSKNAEQQTSMTNSMTVKEFLNNELANKITFTNRSNRSQTEEEFVSLCETRMPEQMKDSSQMIREERSIDSLPSATNRARTSTPVQLFKSTTYRSSSSSNISNGLFSNADDLSSVKGTSNSMKNQTTSDKDDLTVPNISLRLKGLSDCSKSD